MKFCSAAGGTSRPTRSRASHAPTTSATKLRIRAQRLAGVGFVVALAAVDCGCCAARAQRKVGAPTAPRSRRSRRGRARLYVAAVSLLCFTCARYTSAIDSTPSGRSLRTDIARRPSSRSAAIDTRTERDPDPPPTTIIYAKSINEIPTRD